MKAQAFSSLQNELDSQGILTSINRIGKYKNKRYEVIANMKLLKQYRQRRSAKNLIIKLSTMKQSETATPKKKSISLLLTDPPKRPVGRPTLISRVWEGYQKELQHMAIKHPDEAKELNKDFFKEQYIRFVNKHHPDERGKFLTDTIHFGIWTLTKKFLKENYVSDTSASNSKKERPGTTGKDAGSRPAGRSTVKEPFMLPRALFFSFCNTNSCESLTNNKILKALPYKDKYYVCIGSTGSSAGSNYSACDIVEVVREEYWKDKVYDYSSLPKGKSYRGLKAFEKKESWILTGRVFYCRPEKIVSKNALPAGREKFTPKDKFIPKDSVKLPTKGETDAAKFNYVVKIAWDMLQPTIKHHKDVHHGHEVDLGETWWNSRYIEEVVFKLREDKTKTLLYEKYFSNQLSRKIWETIWNQHQDEMKPDRKPKASTQTHTPTKSLFPQSELAAVTVAGPPVNPGKDKTERQMLKRKVESWMGKLDAMTEGERNYLLLSIKEKYPV